VGFKILAALLYFFGLSLRKTSMFLSLFEERKQTTLLGLLYVDTKEILTVWLEGRSSFHAYVLSMKPLVIETP